MKKLVVVLQLHYLLRSSWLGFWVSHFNNLLSCVLLWIYTSRLCPFPALSLCTLVFHFLISPCLFNSVFSPLFLSVPLFSSSCCFFYVLLLLWVSSEFQVLVTFWFVFAFLIFSWILFYCLFAASHLLPAFRFFWILAFFVSSLFLFFSICHAVCRTAEVRRLWFLHIFCRIWKTRKENERSWKDVEVLTDVQCGQVQIQRGHWRLHSSTPQIRLTENTSILYQSVFFPKPHLNFPALHSAPYHFFKKMTLICFQDSVVAKFLGISLNKYSHKFSDICMHTLCSTVFYMHVPAFKHATTHKSA